MISFHVFFSWPSIVGATTLGAFVGIIFSAPVRKVLSEEYFRSFASIGNNKALLSFSLTSTVASTREDPLGFRQRHHPCLFRAVIRVSTDVVFTHCTIFLPIYAPCFCYEIISLLKSSSVPCVSHLLMNLILTHCSFRHDQSGSKGLLSQRNSVQLHGPPVLVVAPERAFIIRNNCLTA